MPFDNTQSSGTDYTAAMNQAFSDLSDAGQDAAQSATTLQKVQQYADLADALIWSNPKVQQWGDQYGLVFLDEGTAGLSTGQAAHNVAEPILRIIYSEGNDVSAYVDLLKGLIAIGKALKTLTSNDAIYEGIQKEMPIFTYTCDNGQLDFQKLGENCADARQKYEDARELLDNPLQLSGFMAYLYAATMLNNWLFQDPNIYVPDYNGRGGSKLRKLGQYWAPTFTGGGPKATAACAVVGVNPWTPYERDKWKIPFPARYTTQGYTICNAEFWATAQNCIAMWRGAMSQDEKSDWILFGLAAEAKGWPPLSVLHDPQKADDYFYKGLATKPTTASAPTTAAATGFSEFLADNKNLLIIGFIIFFLIIAYFLTKK